MNAPRAGGAQHERRKQHPYDTLRERWQFFWRCLVALLVGFFLAWGSERLLPAGEAVKRLLANSYLPWLTATDESPIRALLPGLLVERTSYRATGQAQITVLSIDDADLDSMGLQWPPKLGTYAWLIDQLRKEGARAIFLDILLIDPRPEAEVKALRDSACAAARAGIPVFLASIPGQVVTGSPETQLRQPQDVNGTSRPCIDLASPFTSEDKFDRAAWEYPLCARGLPSAALALACPSVASGRGGTCQWQHELDRCHAPGQALTASTIEDSAAPREDIETDNPKLALVWPAKGSKHNQALLLEKVAPGKQGDATPSYQSACDAKPPPQRFLLPLALVMPQDWPPDWVTTGIPVMLKSFLLEPQPKVLCPYTDLLPMRSFLGQGLTGDDRKKLIGNRLVLIGANFVGHSDRHSAPLHGEVAGVQVHAMALDNLLTYGDRWRRVGEFKLTDWQAPGTLYAVFSVLMIIIGWELQQALGAAAHHLERQGKAPWTDYLFGRKAWMPTWLASAKNLLLAIVSFGLLPTKRRGKLPGIALVGYIVLSLMLWFVLIGLLFFAANDWFRVGPLSQVEYVLAPLALGFIDQGHRIVRWGVLVWASATDPKPAQYVRERRELRKDEDRHRQQQPPAITKTQAEGAGAAGPSSQAPEPPHIPPG